MSDRDNLASRSRASSPTERRSPNRDEILVGKDVLELISSAMYVDPMSIYREYVQNAADSIDAARTAGTLAAEEAGRIDIDVNADARTVIVRDNGAGIPWRHFARRLTALGASVKRGSDARGFRGVGRLAGIGYAQELVFRSRVDGECLVSEVRWDCRLLRTMLRAKDHQDIVDIIREVVSIGRVALPGHPDRFFEVEMRGVIRARNDKLMSPRAVAEYLEQVAPVPFADDFRFSPEIRAALEGHVSLGELDIHVAGEEGPLRRPHRNEISLDETRTAAFSEVEIVKVPAMDGSVAAIAWALHHDYEGAIPTGSAIKGLRVRAGNIQVGDHTLLEDLFSETRFNGWSVGEVHIIDRRIVPNGRRDHFEQTGHYHNVLNHLAPLTRGIAHRCRTGSVKRKWLREFGVHQQAATEKVEVLAQNAVGTTHRKATALSVEQTLLQMDKIADMEILREDLPEELRNATKTLRKKLSKAMSEDKPMASPLARLPARKREMYEHLFELVYDCSTNRVAAKALIDRILMKVI